MPKTAKRILVALAALVALPLLAYVLREPLARALIGAVLPDGTELERLDGLALRADYTQVGVLDFRLSPTMRLRVSGVELRYALDELIRTRTLRAITVQTAALEHTAGTSSEALPETAATATPSVDAAPQTPDLRIGELLALLRDFPVDSIELPAIALPDSGRPLAFTLRDTGNALELRLANEAMQVAGDFSMPDANGPARLDFSLRAADATPVSLQATLEPSGGNYRLGSTASVQLADIPGFLTEQLQTPVVLPVSAADFSWRLDAELADAVFESAATAIALELPEGANVSLSEDAVAGLGALRATLTAASTLHFDADAGLVLADGALPLRLEGLWQAEPFQATTELQARDCHLTGTLACSVAFTADARLAALAFGDAGSETRLYELELAGNGTLALAPGSLDVIIAPGLTLDTANVNGASFTIERLALSNASEIALRQANAEAPALTAGALSLLMHGLKSGSIEIGTLMHFEALDLTLGEEPAGTLKLWTENTYLGNPDELPVFELDADLRLAGERIDFTLGSGLDGIVQAEGSHDLGAGSGTVAVRVPAVTFAGEGKSFSSRLRNWHFPYDLLTGTLAAEVDLQWQPGASVEEGVLVTGTFSARLEDAGGYHGDIFFAGLNTAFEGTIDSAAPLALDTPPLSLRIARVDAGVPVTDIAIDYRFERAANVFAVPALSATVLDGNISGGDIRYDFGSETNAAEIRFENLQIARLIELVEYRGIEASGALSGAIPIGFTPAGIEVKGGTLYAEAPGGVIRYLDGAALAGGNPALDIMNQALGNYHFHSLESGIDYAPDGELLLSMKMQGTNPDMNNGQAINLNLNLNDNIPTLLESLQAGRMIEDFFTEQYERSQEEEREP